MAKRLLEAGASGSGTSTSVALSSPDYSDSQSPTQVILLPVSALALAARPSLSPSTSKMPTKAVKKALPRMTAFSSDG